MQARPHSSVNHSDPLCIRINQVRVAYGKLQLGAPTGYASLTLSQETAAFVATRVIFSWLCILKAQVREETEGGGILNAAHTL